MTDLHRLSNAQALCDEHKLDALLISDPTDLFYLTGFHLSVGRLLFTNSASTLYVDGRYYEACQHHPHIEVRSSKNFSKGSAFIEGLKGKRIGFDGNHLTFNELEELSTLFSGEWVALASPILSIRAVKEPEEIEKLEKAAHLGSRGYDFLLTHLEEGVTEKELVRRLTIFWIEEGGEGFAFEPIIAFGTASASPHYTPSDAPLAVGDPVLIDIGVVVEDYHSDMTRVVFFGACDEEMERIYRVVREAQELAIEAIRPGLPLAVLDQIARDSIQEAGYGKYFPHSLGHGVGLQTHEYPFLRREGTLIEGMVLTIEPGVYLPGKGGVRLEDTVLVTKEGSKNLTKRSTELTILTGAI